MRRERDPSAGAPAARPGPLERVRAMLAAGREEAARVERARLRRKALVAAAGLLLPLALGLLFVLAGRLAPRAAPDPGWYLIGLDDGGRSWYQSAPFATAAACWRELDDPRGAEREDRAAVLAALDERQARAIQDYWARVDAVTDETEARLAAADVAGDDLTWRCVSAPDPRLKPGGP